MDKGLLDEKPLPFHPDRAVKVAQSPSRLCVWISGGGLSVSRARSRLPVTTRAKGEAIHRLNGSCMSIGAVNLGVSLAPHLWLVE